MPWTWCINTYVIFEFNRQTKTISIFDTANQAHYKNIRKRINENFWGICKFYVNSRQAKKMVSHCQCAWNIRKQIMQWYFQKHVKWPNKLEIHVFKITDPDENKYFLLSTFFLYFTLFLFVSLPPSLSGFLSLSLVHDFSCVFKAPQMDKKQVDNVTIIF